MSSRPNGHERVFDAAAEALILFDPDEPASAVDLLTALEAVAGLFELSEDTDHPAKRALAAAQALCAGDMSAAALLDAAFGEVRAEADNAARTSPKKRAKGNGEAGKERSSDSGRSDRKMPLAGDEELLRDFGVRAFEHLDDADERLLALESAPDDRDSVNAVFRAFHTIKGMAGFLSLDPISTFAHESESLLADVRRDGGAVGERTIQALFVAIDKMRLLVADASGVQPEHSSSTPGTGVESAKTGSGASATSARAGTVRVGQDRLDAMLDTIGELVIAESMVSASIRNSDGAAGLDVKLDQLDKITRELQQMATSLRMVTLRATFRRMARLVRDLSQKGGKPVEFVTTGEDTELDKTVVDRIEDPLVHALRNAIDHGIESPEERRRAGKPEVAHIALRAFHSGGAIHIEVADDGRGLDPAKIAEKGAALGLCEADAQLDSRALLDVMCAPGLSTAEAVTDVSGRGVGMDVVRRTVEELRGRIDLASDPGRGTTFSVRLPVTLAIIDGMVLRVGEERFILPLLAIERSVRPTATQLSKVAGRGQMLAVDGEELLPVLPLHSMFSTPSAEKDPTRAVVVIVNDNGARAGLLACELLGQQQTVIKPLGEGLPAMSGITGGAVMPDGRVGLILDAAGLVRLAQERGGD